MALLRDIPIRRKLTLIIMATSAVVLLLSSLVYIVNDVTSMRRQIVENMATLAEMAGATSSAAVVFGDSRSVQETLKFFENLPNVEAAAIFGQVGTVLGEYRRSPEQSIEVPASLSEGGVLLRSHRLHLYQPIMLDGESVGAVYLRSDMEKVHARLMWYAVIVLVVLCVSLLLAYVLSAVLQKAVTDPILDLAGVARSITGEKNYALRARVGGRDEIGGLIEGFNAMLAEIEARDRELLGHRENLQKMIALRTAELESANSKLKLAKENAEHAAEKMTHQAYHDALTGLPNRALLNDHLIIALAQALRQKRMLALMFLDLDRFKVINDSLGHAAGDELLRLVARRLLGCVRREDTVARLGGDEFTILLSSIQTPDDAGRIAQKIIEALAEPLHCQGHELHVTTSIGISVYPDDGAESSVLMRHADTSMYRAKERGRNNYQFWSAELDSGSHKRLAMENELHKALERDQLEVYYQPKVDVKSGRITGAEALARWRHPDLGFVPPDHFIPVAEETGIIHPLGAWIMHAACAQAKAWQDAGHRGLGIAVNLSAYQFRKAGVPELVREALQRSGLKPGHLELEITESIVMQQDETTVAALNELRELGVRLAVDDFGTGYSSLSYLTRFPINTVKIDRGFVSRLDQAGEDASIVTAIVAMAHGLHMQVVAEGVENEQQLQFLRRLKCATAQGYLFSPPVPAEDFARLLVEHSSTKAAGKPIPRIESAGAGG